MAKLLKKRKIFTALGVVALVLVALAVFTVLQRADWWEAVSVEIVGAAMFAIVLAVVLKLHFRK